MPKSFPFSEQQSEMDCGAACLRMVARFYERYYSLAELKELTNFSRDGVSLLDISQAAEKIGFRTLAARLTFEQLVEDVPLPCVVHWKGYHFVVVFEATEEKVTIGDPAVGILELEKSEFLKNWQEIEETDDNGRPDVGVALLFETTPEFLEHSGETEKRTSFSFLKHFFQKQKKAVSQVLIGLLFGSLIQFAMPFFIVGLVDFGINNHDFKFITIVFLAMAVLFASQTLIEFIRGYLLNYLGHQLNLNLLTDFAIKILKLPMRFFEKHTVGDLMQRMADNEKLERFFSSSALFSALSVLNILLFSIVLLTFNTKIFVVFLLGTVAYLGWLRLFFKKLRDLNNKKFEQSSVTHNYFLDLIYGMKEVKLAGAEHQRRWNWEKNQAKLSRISTKSMSVEAWQKRGAFFLNEMKNIVIIVMSAQEVLNGNMTLGMMLATMYIVGQLNAPINQLVEFTQTFQDLSISLERLNEIHQLEDEENGSGKITALPENKNLYLDDVSFQYGASHAPVVLKQLNLMIPEGKITAIVGSSGSGKTTLLHLLLGIYPPVSGAVRIGDVNLKTIREDVWRHKVGAVLQNGHIFNDTLARNIAPADETVDKERLLNAIRIANLQRYVDGLPSNYNTLIGLDGVGMSEGIRQRILIARAVYKNPDYLFLDEATNALDSFNEILVMENLREHFEGKTMVIAAHRLGAVKFADQIVILEDGEIVESGSHYQLSQKRGAYYHLLRQQTELGN